MALTATAKEELARVPVTRLSERLAEVVGILRFGGGLQLLPGRLIIETELDHEGTAYRLRTTLRDIFGPESELITLNGSASRRGTRYVLRIMDGGAELARKPGLLDPRGRPVRGMPPSVVNGSVADAAAAWRGAFLTQGVLTEPGRSSALEVVAPGPEAALALVGAARRLGVTAKAREVRQTDRVIVRDAGHLIFRTVCFLLGGFFCTQNRQNLATAPDHQRGAFPVESPCKLRRCQSAPLRPSRRGSQRPGDPCSGNSRQ